MLILIVCVSEDKPLENISPPSPVNNMINLPNVGQPIGFKRSVWVNELLNGHPTDFGCYMLTVKNDSLLIDDIPINIKPILTNATPFSVEFDNKIILVRGSPFIKTSILPDDIDKFYVLNGYIWLKLDLPNWYGELNPSFGKQNIKIVPNIIQISYDQKIYYWIPKYLSFGWHGDVIYHRDNKLLVNGDGWNYQYSFVDYPLIKNLDVDIYDQSLKYNIEYGLIVDIPLVIDLIKESYLKGIPTNQAQRDRLILLSNSLLNHQHSPYFTILPIIDMYLMKTNGEITINDALNILGNLVKWNF